MNPSLEFAVHGPDASKGAEFSPNVEAAYDVSRRVNLALEYYGNFGEVFHPDAFASTEQELFPAINYDFGPDREFNAGIGIALTHHTDVVGLKVIVGRRVGMKAKH